MPLASVAPRRTPRRASAQLMILTIKTYYYGRQSIFIGRLSRYSCSTHIFALTVTCDLDFQSRRAIIMTRTHAKIKVRGQFVQKIEWKRTNRRTRPIALPFPLTQSVIISSLITLHSRLSFSTTIIVFIIWRHAHRSLPTGRYYAHTLTARSSRVHAPTAVPRPGRLTTPLTKQMTRANRLR